MRVQRIHVMADGYIAPGVLAEKAGTAVGDLARGSGTLRERVRAAAHHLYGPRWIVENFPERDRADAKFVQDTFMRAHLPEVSEHDLQIAVDKLRCLEDDLNDVMFKYRYGIED